MKLISCECNIQCIGTLDMAGRAKIYIKHLKLEHTLITCVTFHTITPTSNKNPDSASSVTLLGSVVHEMRTPMNSLLSLLQLLEGFITNEGKHYFNSAVRTSNAIFNLFSDALEYVQLAQNRLKIHKALFDIRKVIANAIECFASHAQQKGLQLLSEIDPMLPLYYFK